MYVCMCMNACMHVYMYLLQAALGCRDSGLVGNVPSAPTVGLHWSVALNLCAQAADVVRVMLLPSTRDGRSLHCCV